LKDSKYQHLMFASSDRDLSVDPIQSLRLSSDSQSVEGSEDSESDDTEGFDADLETLNDSKVAKYKSKHARSDREAKIEKMWRRKARKLSMSKYEHIAFRSSTESLVDVQSPISRRRCKKSTVVPQLSWQHDEVDIIRVQTPLNKGYVEGIDWFKGPKIGFGGSCSCFQARDVKTGKLMAVKQIHIPPPIGRMVRDTCSSSVVSEIHFLRTLDHPNVVKLVGATKGPLFYNIFMEWCPNGTVSRLLQQYGRFEDSVISVYIKQLLEGLRYIHSRRIIHRDIKGSNLLIAKNGKKLKITDFGSAAMLSSSKTFKGEFKDQMTGTIAYMSPEVLRGEHYGRSTDIWGCGCVIVEMCTGAPPWSENYSNQFSLLYFIGQSSSSPDAPADMNCDMKDMCSLCFNKDPNRRPTAEQLLQHSFVQ